MGSFDIEIAHNVYMWLLQFTTLWKIIWWLQSCGVPHRSYTNQSLEQDTTIAVQIHIPVKDRTESVTGDKKGTERAKVKSAKEKESECADLRWSLLPHIAQRIEF